MKDTIKDIFIEAKELESGNLTLRAAAELALSHLQELRDAWQRGSLSCCDGNNGLRSNLNVDVECLLRDALALPDSTAKDAREWSARIAESIDSGRGNEKEIAKAIRQGPVVLSSRFGRAVYEMNQIVRQEEPA